MKLTIQGKTYLVTNMFVVGKAIDATMKFNVFDENYKFVTSIDCEDEDEFIKLFNNYLNNKSPFKL